MSNTEISVEYETIYDAFLVHGRDYIPKFPNEILKISIKKGSPRLQKGGFDFAKPITMDEAESWERRHR